MYLYSSYILCTAQAIYIFIRISSTPHHSDVSDVYSLSNPAILTSPQEHTHEVQGLQKIKSDFKVLIPSLSSLSSLLSLSSLSSLSSLLSLLFFIVFVVVFYVV